MPQDMLQISLEHHRTGRLTQAQAGYRGACEVGPGQCGGMDWLGVLTYQAGQFKEAVPLLERAAANNPTDAAFQHNLGQAYMDAGRKDDAVKAFSRATAANPTGAESVVSLASACLAHGGRRAMHRRLSPRCDRRRPLALSRPSFIIILRGAGSGGAVCRIDCRMSGGMRRKSKLTR